MLKNNLKNCKRIEVFIFRIKVSTVSFTAKISYCKLKKVIEKMEKVLNNALNLIPYFNTLLFIIFLSFCSQKVRLKKLCMQKLWDFVNYFQAICQKLQEKEFLAR